MNSTSKHYIWDLCTECNGTGIVKCPHCDDGLVARDVWTYRDEPFQIIEYCDICGGSTKIDCPNCGGSGALQAEGV